MVTIKQIFQAIDKFAEAFFDLINSINAEAEEVKAALERAINGSLSQPEAQAALDKLNTLQGEVIKAKEQVMAFAPTYETPEAPLPPGTTEEPTPVEIPSEENLENSVEITNNDNIGFPGVPSIDFI